MPAAMYCTPSRRATCAPCDLLRDLDAEIDERVDDFRFAPCAVEREKREADAFVPQVPRSPSPRVAGTA